MRALVLALALVVTSSCCGTGVAGAQPPLPTNDPQYVLTTHCGILYTYFAGQWYYADPPNPAGNWPNPTDTGAMTVIDRQTIVFTDAVGNRAGFTTTPGYTIPIVQPCD